MAKQLVCTKVYKDMTTLLYNEHLIEEIPTLRWTKDRSCYGFIRFLLKKNLTTGWTEEIVDAVYLNKAYCPTTLKQFITKPNWAFNNFFELIDTVAHELAHMTHHEHNEKHAALTKKYKDAFYSAYGYMSEPSQVIEYLKDCKAE